MKRLYLYFFIGLLFTSIGAEVIQAETGSLDRNFVRYEMREKLFNDIENLISGADDFIYAINGWKYLLGSITPSAIANYMEVLANEGMLELIPSHYFIDEDIKNALDVVFEDRTNISKNWNVYEIQWLQPRICTI